MGKQDNFSTFRQLQEKYPTFTYEACRYYSAGYDLVLEFSFNISDKIFFNPKIRIPYNEKIFKPLISLSSEILSNLVFHAGLIEMISYWKAACPARVIIKPNYLDNGQLKFWKRTFYNGLGEFFFMNSIDIDEENFMKIETIGDKPLKRFEYDASGRIVPVGGGKDSAVTMGLLNRENYDWIPFAINPTLATRNVIAVSGKNDDEMIVFYREIDPALLRLNEQGFLNGHTPFSALLAFYSLLAAFLTGSRDIILSNESSANEPTVPGTNINHQYSKTYEFESDFREYVRTNISPGFNYFSLLRPLPELHIARLFAGFPEYFRSFRSCNTGSKTGTWCGKCPKCLFTYIILSPFLVPSTLVDIFGKNLLDDRDLIAYFDELTGYSKIKPFECIGTVDEVNAALYASRKMYDKSELPYLFKIFLDRDQDQHSIRSGSGQLLTWHDDAHFVPDEYFKMIKGAVL